MSSMETRFSPLSPDEVPKVLFRAECNNNRSLSDGSLCARVTHYEGPPSEADFDNTLSWQKKIPTRLRCFSTNWQQTLKRRAKMEEKARKRRVEMEEEARKRGAKMEKEEEECIVVIAVWAKGLRGVYNAVDVASTLGYSEKGTVSKRKIWDHRQEFLVDGGILANEYRILAIFEGGGPERPVVFECPMYRISTLVPSGFFCGRRTGNALRDIEDEIYSHTGVRDDQKRDELMKAIQGAPANLFIFPNTTYM
ncbi:hypothetical protein BJX99DRAFT_262951 [Aspergillus californicus]